MQCFASAGGVFIWRTAQVPTGGGCVGVGRAAEPNGTADQKRVPMQVRPAEVDFETCRRDCSSQTAE
ncbi:hypothetical protein BaRGS_00027629, partial [Batillaria attramentaria]